MCMEDIRLGRQLGPTVFRVSLNPATLTPIIPVTRGRTRIIISTDAADPVFVKPEGMISSGLFGFCITVAQGQMILRVEDWGRLIEGAFSAQCPTNAVELAIMTTVLEKT